jgi:hypothetical protein
MLSEGNCSSVIWRGITQNINYPMGTRVKRRGREADHLSPSNADVKNVWSYVSAPQIRLVMWRLVKHKDFTFTFGPYAYVSFWVLP